MKYLIILSAMLCLSCNSQLKQLRKFNTYANEHPDKLAALCAKEFKSDTVYKPGTTVTKIDTVTQTVTADCPDGTTVTIPVTKYIDRHHYRVDTVEHDKPGTLAKLNDVSNDYRTAADSIVVYKILLSQAKADVKSKTKQLWILGAAAGAMLIGGIIIALKRIGII